METESRASNQETQDLRHESVLGGATLPPRLPWFRRRSMQWIAGSLAVLLVVLFIVSEYEMRHANTFIRHRIEETLEARFGREVVLDKLNIGMGWGVVKVRGSGLRVSSSAPNPQEAIGKPLLSVPSFEFSLNREDFLRPSLVTVTTHGMVLDIPTLEDRREHPAAPIVAGKPSLVLLRLIALDAKLLLEPSAAGKEPLEYDFSRLELTQSNDGVIDGSKPLAFEATARNARPVGDVYTRGTFGPWSKEDPAMTPLEGDLKLTNADLSSIRGLVGDATATMHYKGTLGRLEVDGSTDSPDFRMDVSAGPMLAHLDIDSIVDGTTGEVQLEHVSGLAGTSKFTASGMISRTPGVTGRNVDLKIDMPAGSTDDMLRLFTKTSPPIMHGVLLMKAHLLVPASGARVIERLRMDGTARVSGGVWSSSKVQTNVNDISERGLGDPKLAKPGEAAAVTSDISGQFNVEHAQVDIKGMEYQIPGVTMLVDGRYQLRTEEMDFYGLARAKASVAGTQTGIKHLLLKPLDPFFRKPGAGLQIPVEVKGAKNDVDFAFDFKHGARDKAAASDSAAGRADAAGQKNTGGQIRKK